MNRAARAALAALTVAGLAGCTVPEAAPGVPAVVEPSADPDPGARWHAELVSVGDYWVQCVRVHDSGGGLSCDWSNKILKGED